MPFTFGNHVKLTTHPKQTIVLLNAKKFVKVEDIDEYISQSNNQSSLVVINA